MSNSLKQWQERKLKQFQKYLETGVWSFEEFKREKQRVLNPPDWFIEQMNEAGMRDKELYRN